MALTALKLKDRVYVTLDDIKDWLGIPLTEGKYDRKLTFIANAAVDQIEKYIEGPVLNQRFVTTKDGNSANVIVPEYWPVRYVEELRIDFNRKFDNPAVDPQNLVLRGLPEMNNVKGNFTVEMKGMDIVMRDDNNTSILGRIFAGSVIGSIRLSYVAGWGKDIESLPADLVLATLMLIEYYYDVKQQKYMNMKSKKNGDQDYQREMGIPKEITDMLDQYKDYSVGPATVPQKNTFTI